MDVWAAVGIARSYPTTTKIGLKICAFGADDAVGLMLRKLRFLKAVNTSPSPHWRFCQQPPMRRIAMAPSTPRRRRAAFSSTRWNSSNPGPMPKGRLKTRLP